MKTKERFIRDLAELIEPNFNLEIHLVDDGDYYSKFPQLHVHWDNNSDNDQSKITIDKGESDDVWVHPSAQETFVCKPDLNEVLYCLYIQIKEKQKMNGGEFPNLPCEQKK